MAEYTAHLLAADFGDDPELLLYLQKKIKQHNSAYKKKLKPHLLVDAELSWVKDEVAKLGAERDHGTVIKLYERVITLITTPKDAPTTGVSEAQIEQARDYPITEIIEFKRGFAPCPFHIERTASLHIIPRTNETRAYCHGECGRAYNAIDAYMLIHNCNFLTAVRALTQ